MVNFEVNKEVAENIIICNGVKFVVDDNIANSILKLLKGDESKSTTDNTTKIRPVKAKKYSFKDKDVKWCKPVKVDGGYAYGLDGYVNTLTFRYIAECLKDSSRYVKGIGFIFAKKSDGDKLTKSITKVTAAQQEAMMK